MLICHKVIRNNKLAGRENRKKYKYFIRLNPK